jgi:integrase
MPATHKAHVYSLLRVILGTAVKRRMIPVNPCQVDGGGRTPKRPMPDLPSAVDVGRLADAMGSPKYRTLVLVAAWTGLRFGEATELRRKDVVTDESGVPYRLRVRRAVTHVNGTAVVGLPKSSAGVRDVGIPPHIRPDLAAYLAGLPAGPERLLFPGSRSGTHLRPSSLYRVFYRARDAVGFPALRWHDLRHFSGTVAAQSGATLAELQARLGHSTVQAAMTYQWAVAGRDDVIAEAMSNVVPLRAAQSR